MALEAPILLLDEPIAELDPIGKATVLEKVSELNKQLGLTVIFIDHNIDMLSPYADRVAIVSQGELQAVGTPKEIFFGNQELIIKAGLRPPQIVELDSMLAAVTPHSGGIPLTVDELINKYALTCGKQPIQHQDENENFRQPLLSMHQVDFGYYKGQNIISNLNLTVNAGDFIGLVGQNGAGKKLRLPSC